jgi:hypothetical protein
MIKENVSTANFMEDVRILYEDWINKYLHAYNFTIEVKYEDVQCEVTFYQNGKEYCKVLGKEFGQNCELKIPHASDLIHRNILTTEAAKEICYSIYRNYIYEQGRKERDLDNARKYGRI